MKRTAGTDVPAVCDTTVSKALPQPAKHNIVTLGTRGKYIR